MPSHHIPLRGQISDVDLRLLRIFRKVVESGGFSAAEVELNISRAAISMAMNDLEGRLSMRLCQRGRSGFALTPEGQSVYEAALQLLTATENFRTHINSLHSRLTGELNIGIADNLVTMPEMHITEALRALKTQGENVHINIRMAPPKEIEMATLKGSLHTGVVPGLKHLPGLNYTLLYREESVLYCSSRHPLFAAQYLRPEDIASHDAVVPAYAQTPDVKQLHSGLNPMASATDREGIAFLILTGRYIGFLPTHFAQRWVDNQQMKALNPQHFHYDTDYYAITRKGAPPNMVLETYWQSLSQLINPS